MTRFTEGYGASVAPLSRALCSIARNDRWLANLTGSLLRRERLGIGHPKFRVTGLLQMFEQCRAPFSIEMARAYGSREPPVRRAQLRERPLVLRGLLIVFPQQPHEAAHEEQIHGERDDTDRHMEEL